MCIHNIGSRKAGCNYVRSSSANGDVFLVLRRFGASSMPTPTHAVSARKQPTNITFSIACPTHAVSARKQPTYITFSIAFPI
jgi:hypothetical protein